MGEAVKKRTKLTRDTAKDAVFAEAMSKLILEGKVVVFKDAEGRNVYKLRDAK